MAFGQSELLIIPSWGVAPGYGESRPSANRVEPKMHNFKTCASGSCWIVTRVDYFLGVASLHCGRNVPRDPKHFLFVFATSKSQVKTNFGAAEGQRR